MIEKTTFEKYVGRAGIALGAGSTFTHSESEIVDWMDNENPPTDEALNAKIVELQAEYDAQEYARNRATEYPALAEQLDEIYHNGIDSWKAVIKVTKDKYPKG
jgi:hypothetical protein